jgi:uncharacterized protein YndB with AHSA1/START domain
MSGADEIPAIRHSVTIDAPPGDAFAGFTDGMSAWWPRELTWSGELLESIGIEGRPGGLCYEIASNGMRFDWGRVATWEPPRRLAFSWQIGPDRVPQPNPARASQVQVEFRPAAGGGTRVTVSHVGWERHGEGGAAYRQQMVDAAAWPTILERYAGAVERRGDAPWTGLTT